MNQAYCVKCKSKKYMLHEEEVTLKNGSAAIRGDCVTCNTKLYKMLGKPKEPKEPKVVTTSEVGVN